MKRIVNSKIFFFKSRESKSRNSNKTISDPRSTPSSKSTIGERWKLSIKWSKTSSPFMDSPKMKSDSWSIFWRFGLILEATCKLFELHTIIPYFGELSQPVLNYCPSKNMLIWWHESSRLFSCRSRFRKLGKYKKK